MAVGAAGAALLSCECATGVLDNDIVLTLLSSLYRADPPKQEPPIADQLCIRGYPTKPSQMGPLRVRRRLSIKALAMRCRPPSQVSLPHPTIATLFRQFPHITLAGTDRPANSYYSRTVPNQTLHYATPGLTLSPGLKHPNPACFVTMDYKANQDPLIRTASPAPLAQDFARQQVSKQQRSNYHSSSLTSPPSHTMVSQSVNKTGLHPAGVQ